MGRCWGFRKGFQTKNVPYNEIYFYSKELNAVEGLAKQRKRAVIFSTTGKKISVIDRKFFNNPPFLSLTKFADFVYTENTRGCIIGGKR